MGLFLLLLFLLGSNSKLLQDSLALFARGNTGVGVVEQSSELIELIKGGVVSFEVDIERDAERDGE